MKFIEVIIVDRVWNAETKDYDIEKHRSSLIRADIITSVQQTDNYQGDNTCEITYTKDGYQQKECLVVDYNYLRNVLLDLNQK